MSDNPSQNWQIVYKTLTVSSNILIDTFNLVCMHLLWVFRSQTSLTCLAIRCPWCLVIKSKTQWTTRVLGWAGLGLGWAGLAGLGGCGHQCQDQGDAGYRRPAATARHHTCTLLQLQSGEHLSDTELVCDTGSNIQFFFSQSSSPDRDLVVWWESIIYFNISGEMVQISEINFKGVL